MTNAPGQSKMEPAENPPPYESVAQETRPALETRPITGDGKGAQQNMPKPYRPDVGPSPYSEPRVPTVPSMPSTTVYHYVNPATGDRMASLLPPDHPEMICLQEGRHVAETRYGLLGILAAVFWFPLGIGLCLLDRKVRCRRCGLWIDEGFCA